MKAEFREIGRTIQRINPLANRRWNTFTALGLSTTLVFAALACSKPIVVSTATPTPIEQPKKNYTYVGDKVNAEIICNAEDPRLFNVLIRGKVDTRGDRDYIITTLTSSEKRIRSSLDQGGRPTIVAVTSVNGSIGSISGEGSIELQKTTSLIHDDYSLDVYSVRVNKLPHLNPANRLGGVSFAADCR